jgi:hypothetical protein
MNTTKVTPKPNKYDTNEPVVTEMELTPSKPGHSFEDVTANHSIES